MADESQRVDLFGIRIDALALDAAVRRIDAWLHEPSRPCRLVVTPNVNHLVRLESDRAFRQVYADADLVLVDGRPVAWLARLFGDPLPGVVPGSDLVPAVLEHIDERGLVPGPRVFLLGAAPGVAARAATRIAERWPGVTVCGHYSPPLGFERDPTECAAICGRVAAAQTDLLVVGLGAPKQEIWTHRFKQQLPVKAALCVGATIDFLAGHRQRAPRWMSRAGIEWLHRMATEPRRLVKRYAFDALHLPAIVFREAGRRRARRGRP